MQSTKSHHLALIPISLLLMVISFTSARVNQRVKSEVLDELIKELIEEKQDVLQKIRKKEDSENINKQVREDENEIAMNEENKMSEVESKYGTIIRSLVLQKHQDKLLPLRELSTTSKTIGKTTAITNPLKAKKKNNRTTKAENDTKNFEFSEPMNSHALDNDPTVPITIMLVRETTECLYGHDEIRALYQADKLNWDADLAYRAEEWALILALQNNGARHSTFKDSNGNNYGENLYWYRGSDQKNCHDAIYLWYQEYKDFNFIKPEFSYTSGHFIQLIWQPTYKLGVGIAYAHDQTWVVARYTPSEQAEPGDIHEHVGFPQANPNIAIDKLIPSYNPSPFIENVKISILPSTEIDCIDKDENCEYWQMIGQCESNPNFMKGSCPYICNYCTPGTPINGGWTKWAKATSCSVSCGSGTFEEHRFCINPDPSNGGLDCYGNKRRLMSCKLSACEDSGMCSDRNKDCNGYKQLNYCNDKQYKAWMEIYCQESCNLCCADYHKDCEGYKTLNYCNDVTYGPFMKLNCAKACAFC